ncbi:MAG: hypothetical protein KJ587_10825 [Alphaproteobacteria bacterium]|nr:hypothetical protein [Alphaproteobacteria bacterium]
MRSLVLTAAILGAAAISTGAQAGSCVKAGGEATMLTEDLAQFMANAALNNQIKANGWTASGQVTMKCEAATIGTHCVAHQKACK